MSKIINDPIHGHYKLSEISFKIIDTPQFQRLRDISQLSSVFYVFPAASSKRFEHSLGVAHLSREFIMKLHENQPYLNITKNDMLCVEIAGLIHDIGHGPFSHLFDGNIIPKLMPHQHFEHEIASIEIFDLLIKENKLLPTFLKFGLNESDIDFIKELVIGVPLKGRGEKTFLYDIVANKRNGIDIDKFDYMARDCHVLGLSKSFDSSRLMNYARVCRVHRNSGIQTASQTIDGISQLEVCYHHKEAWNIFEVRSLLEYMSIIY